MRGAVRTMKIPYRVPVTVPRETTLVEAAERMEQAGVGSLLVVDGDQLVGIVTDRDLALRAVARRMPYDGRIDAVMTTGVVTVPATADREKVLRIFRGHAIRRLPVIDGGRVIGLVALDDLVADASVADLPTLAAAVSEEIRHPHHEAGLPLPAAVARPPAPQVGRWQARVGDKLIIHTHVLNQPSRDGEILGVHSPAGDPPFLVRWSSDGRVSFVYPGPDAEIRHFAATDGTGTTSTTSGLSGTGAAHAPHPVAVPHQ
jgi:CBS domain-containing protein